MQDPTIHYEAAIEAVRNAHERYNIAVQALADAEEELERKTLDALLDEGGELAGYMAHASNDTQRKDRRTKWVNDHLLPDLEAMRTAKRGKAEAEMLLEHARNLRSLARLRCEWAMAGGNTTTMDFDATADLLGPEPKVGFLPADPRGVPMEALLNESRRRRLESNLALRHPPAAPYTEEETR